MDFSSFWTSLGAYFLIFVVLMLLYTWLSRKPKNAMVYYPNRILKDMEPWEGGSRTRNPFAWIQEALSSSEQDVIAMSGVDTAVYFVFLNTVLGILVLSGVVLLPILIAVVATNDIGNSGATNTSSGSLDNRTMGNVNVPFVVGRSDVTNTRSGSLGNRTMGNVNVPFVVGLSDATNTSSGTFANLTMENIEKKSPRLCAFLIATYWVSFVTYYLLWKAYKHVSTLRANSFMSMGVKPEQFAILVRDIPTRQGQIKKEQVELYFKAIYLDTYYNSMVIPDIKEVNKIWEELEGYRKKLALAEALYAESKSTAKQEGERPSNRTGFLGLFGKKVDSIELYNEKIKELIPKLESERKVTLREKQQGAALVFFTSRLTAASAAQSLHAQLVDNWTVIAAPEPRQLIWNNLKIKFFQRKVRHCVAYISAAFCIIPFYMILLLFIVGLLSLSKLKSRAISKLLEALFPIPFDLFLALIRKLFLLLSKAEGIPTESHAVRAASGKYFYLCVLGSFIPVLLSVVTSEIVKATSGGLLGHEDFLQKYTTLFMTFLAYEAFVSSGLELSRSWTLIRYHLKTKYWYKTEAQRKEACSPGDLNYGTRVPDNMVILTLVLCYSVVAPLLIPFGVAYFGVAWLVLRNQALKVYVPSYESYGRMWPHIHKRILVSLVFCQVTMLCFLGVRQLYYMFLLIPLPILSLLFGYTSSRKFYRFFRDTALEVACRPLNEVPNMDQVFRAFIPPSLHFEKSDDDQFEDV